MTTALVLAAMVLASVAALLWVLSLATEDVSTVDIMWGAAFAVVGWIHWSGAAEPTDRSVLLFAMSAIWGLRLAAHIGWRKRRAGRGEDRRYGAMRTRHGLKFRRFSLYLVFLFQAALIFIIALPIQFGAWEAAPLNGWDFLGALLWGVGFCFEAVGDLQLARFAKDPKNAGAVMDRGLWAWTRHPNYFGDFCVWWGIWLVAFGAGLTWTIVSPILMSILLYQVSGKALLEKTIGDRRPDYAEYARRTSGFFPLPPKAR
jgi:steroid 5-alpha reductase family enzyme